MEALALGVDPDAHQLVLPDSRPATAQLETISQAKHAPVPAAKPVLTPPPVATTPESPSPPAASNTGAKLRRRSHSPPQRRALSPLASSRALEDEAALGSSTDLNLRPLRSPVSTAFVLGKERVVERKVELSGAERLAENL
ncbi:hypothetical protein HaLaN_19504 [Haematococcus lacustris]|uniref:Uncharacterized protein n=1 Tax=Haematococcus lacustris TaxID=44745 RepID=A0A699ZHL3_HAELA|nr:hypothetical protein HaLaN_19504 [Haematococcus lacustris]